MMVSLYYAKQDMHSFSMRPAKYFYDKPLPKYLDPKTVLIYHPQFRTLYFVTLFDFLSLKNDVNVPSKSNKQKKLC
jgi:hypothetical protein